MTSGRYGIVLAALLAVPIAVPLSARADAFVTTLGTTPFAACAKAAAEAKRTGVGTRAALAVCDQAIATWPSPPIEMVTAYVNRSVVQLALAHVAAAIVDTSAAIRLNPALAEAYLDRGIALSTQHRNEAAIEDFSRALALHLGRPALAYFDRAMAREDSGDIKGAYLDYRQAAALSPAWDKPRLELARFTVVHAPAS